MPSELDHAYERDWEYISGLPKYALDIFRWVTFALRPLTTLEITEALLIEDNDNCDDLQSDELPDDVDKDFVDEQITGLCGSLLEIRSSSVEKMQSPGSNTIHLAHFSVKEYLLAMIPDKSVLFLIATPKMVVLPSFVFAILITQRFGYQAVRKGVIMVTTRF